MWGPYLSERQWGTVREDYSPGGTAWEALSHDAARSRAYRWGEDGMLGISDDQQILCFALALWNGRDPILKERLFGLTNSEGNHGEDVKECYYYLDATPTHSYLKALYKYPQRPFPYAQLVEENRRRGKHDPEFELIDTGAFDEQPLLRCGHRIREAVAVGHPDPHHGPQPRPGRPPTCTCCRSCGSATPGRGAIPVRKPELTLDGDVVVARSDAAGNLPAVSRRRRAVAVHGQRDQRPPPVRTAGAGRVTSRTRSTSSSSIGNARRDQPAARAAPRPPRTIASRCRREGTAVVRLRLSADTHADPFAGFDSLIERRRREADDFYDRLQTGLSDDQRLVQRQALAGMIWSKQFFYYDVPQWLKGDPGQPPPPPERARGRNHEWTHLNNADIISMPDKWEYPWYAAWDLAFHTISLALVDPEFAKQQLVLLTREWYMHPNGQLPAYEWAFGDVNPPVHGWATWRVFQMDRKRRRLTTQDDPGDLAFLERVFHKLMLNFTWWVNRKDAEGRNVFQGGFLGLDNIGVFDRSAPLPTGGYINQSDGTSWMAMYSLNLMRIALELAQHNHVYEDIATKFFEHFLHIAEAMTNIGDGHGPVERGGRLLLRRAQSAGRPDAAAQGAVDGRADPAVRRRNARARALRQGAGLHRAARLVSQLSARSGGAGVALERAGKGRAAAAVAAARQPHEEAAAPHARRDGVPVRLRRARALAASPRASVHARVERPALLGRVSTRRIDVRAVWRQLELARADLDAGQLPDHRVAAEVPPLLRRRLQGGVPDRVRPLSHHRRGRERTAPRA